MGILWCTFIILGSTPDEGQGLSPYTIDPVIDGTLTAGTVGLMILTDVFARNSLRPTPACSLDTQTGVCDPSALNALDQKALGYWSTTWQHLSDVGISTAYALPLLVGALDSLSSESSTPWGDWGTDLLVIMQAATLTSFANSMIRYALRRPRPSQYNPEQPVEFGFYKHQFSFPSGHTAVTAAVTMAYAMTFALRHLESPWRWVMYASAAALTLFTGYARVAGGMHFYTDILAGATLGTVFGTIVPWLHRQELSIGLTQQTSAHQDGKAKPFVLTVGLPF
jgi:membrane-associated phospholipid phosphatase